MVRVIFHLGGSCTRHMPYVNVTIPVYVIGGNLNFSSIAKVSYIKVFDCKN